MQEETKMYKVYRIWPRSSAYVGYSLIAAESVEEANEIIQELRDSDKDNDYDSYAYSDVSEADLIEDLSSNRIGIIVEGFHYTGN